MNARMMDLLDRLAQREREEEAPGYIEILPPLHAEIGHRGAFAEPRYRMRVVNVDGGEELATA